MRIIGYSNEVLEHLGKRIFLAPPYDVEENGQHVSFAYITCEHAGIDGNRFDLGDVSIMLCDSCFSAIGFAWLKQVHEFSRKWR